MDVTRESVMFTDSDDDLNFKKCRKVLKSDENFPDAFLHAIREGDIKSLTISGSSCSPGSSYTSSISSLIDSDISAGHHSPKEFKPRDHLTMIPESVIAALTNIQRSQLRRVREDASSHLESVLRNVVKIVDGFYADQLSREQSIPVKKMMGSEDEEEARIKEEIRKILKGEVDSLGANMRRGTQMVKKRRRRSAVDKNDEEQMDEEENGIVTTVEKVEEPVCQVMLNIIGDLSEISADRHTLLTEVLEWMQRYPANSYLHFRDTPSGEFDEYQFVDEANLFTDWDVKKNIRRLSIISEELGLVKLHDKQEKDDRDDKRKLLEEKMNKQKSRFVAMKVFDVELLSDAKNWRAAATAISQVLDDSANSSNNPRSKQMFGNAHKQFRFMTECAERRNDERLKLDSQLITVSGKLNKEKKEVKALKKKKQTLETQIERCQDDILELKKELEIRDEILKERSEQIYELECMNEEQAEALKAEHESAKNQPPPYVAPVIQKQQQQQEPPPTQNEETKQQNATTTVSKEKVPSPEKLQPPKQKTARRTSKDAGVPKKKENKEEEKRKKQEKEKEESRRTSVIMSLKEAKAELEQIKKAGEAREIQVKELKIQLETETAKFEQEKAKFEDEIQFHKLQTNSVKKQLVIEQELWERTKDEMLQEKTKLTNEVRAKEEIINFQEQRIQEVAREMTLSLMRAGLQANTSTPRGNATDKLMESKQMLAKLHLQYEYEMQKLRTYVKRETERHQADTRRLETDYRERLNNIYRDTSVIFRAVNRFKDCLAILFDREINENRK